MSQTRDDEFDVVVVGSGGAGLTAAILAHDHGAEVAGVEARCKNGGQTARPRGPPRGGGPRLLGERP